MATQTKIVLLVIVLAVLGSVTLRDETRLSQEIENAAHAPVQSRVCPKCHVENRTNAKFCNKCGHPF